MAAGYSSALRNAQLDTISATVGNAGRLVIYAGSRPATGGAAGTVLATFTLGSPFAPAASGGALYPSLPVDVSAVATGTATWARIFKSDASTVVMDLGVGTSGQDVTINSTGITSGLTCSVTAFSISCGNA